MKTRVLLAIFLAFAAFAPAVRAGDILLNGDFSDGKTHWHGDGDVPDLGGKLVVTLKPDKWTVLYQKINSEASTLKLEITYSYSDDCTLAQRHSDGAPVPPLTGLGLEQATGLENGIGMVNLSEYAEWMVLLVSDGWNYGTHPVSNYYGNTNSATDSSGSKTFTTTLSKWNHQFMDDPLCLAFPPGKGSVTITEVKIIPPAN